MKAIIGKKVGMTRVVDQHDKLVAATIIVVEPNYVTQLKTKDTDGYEAVQLGVGDLRRARKPQRERIKKIGAPAGRFLAEFRNLDPKQFKLGQKVGADIFQPGDIVTVVGISRGRGFAGTVKRHNFKMGPRSHGSHNIRQPGSIGSTYPQRVIPGKRMAGHLGAARTTIKHLEVLDVQVKDSDNILVVRGSVPGVRGGRLLIKQSK